MSDLIIQIDRLDALFAETPFRISQPELHSSLALERLVSHWRASKLEDGKTLIIQVVSEPLTPEDEAAAIRAIRIYCERRVRELRCQVIDIRRTGWLTLRVGMLLLVAALGLSWLFSHFEPLPNVFNRLFSESFIIAGWVILWRPLDLLFYEWLSPARDARTYEWLARLPLKLTSTKANMGNTANKSDL